MQVESLSRAMDLLQGSALIVDEALCLNLRGRTLSCTACSDLCETGALQLTVDGIEPDADRCSGCGACVPVCPTGVMRLSGFSPVRFLQALEDRHSVHLHCTASTDPGGGIVIPCHRILDPRLLAVALARGTGTFLLHGLGACGACEKGDARGHVQQVSETLDRWFGEQAPGLDVLEAGCTATAEERMRADQPAMSRRGFLRLAGARATLGGAAWILPEAGAGETGPASLLFYQADGEVKRPLVAQQLFAGAVTELPWTQGQPLPWRTRSVADACNACMVCGERCPTGALVAVQGADRLEIDFEPALCTDCGLCERLCPVSAVQPRGVWEPAEVVAPRGVLMHRTLSRCDGCGRTFPADGGSAGLCQVCRNELDLDEEWLGMLEG